MNEIEKNIDSSIQNKNKNSIKSISRRILNSDGNLILLSIAILILALSVVLPFLIESTIFYLFDFPIDAEGYEIVWAVISFICFAALAVSFVFVTLPMLSGVYILARKIANGEKPMLAELFAPFLKPKDYFNSILIGFVTVIRLAVVILPCVGGIALIPTLAQLMYAASPIMIIAVSVFLLFACIAVFLVAAYIASYLYLISSLMLSGIKLKAAIAISIKASHRSRDEIMKNIFFSTWLAILSVLSFGIVFIVYAGPMMLVSYFIACREISHNN